MWFAAPFLLRRRSRRGRWRFAFAKRGGRTAYFRFFKDVFVGEDMSLAEPWVWEYFVAIVL